MHEFRTSFAFPAAFQKQSRHLTAVMAAASLVGLLCVATSAAQEKRKDEDRPRMSPPEDVALSTEDGVQLVVTYYPGGKGKESVPVVLLHAWKGSRHDYRSLALLLQAEGHAVIAADLRGHGDSTLVKAGARTETLQLASFGPQQYGMMITADMEAIKDFVREKNNAGELNINKLCVVGAEMGASVALGFAANDWEVPPVGAHQMGRFIKALVLISPEQTFKGLSIKAAIANPDVRSQIDVFLLVGNENPKAVLEAKRLYDIFLRYHPDQVHEEDIKKVTIKMRPLDTMLQGTKMLDAKGLDAKQRIAKFIEYRLVRSEEAKGLRWKVFQKNPYH